MINLFDKWDQAARFQTGPADYAIKASHGGNS